MEKIEIDDEVYSCLQKNARPFVDTPNTTLRRLLGIDTTTPISPQVTASTAAEQAIQELITESQAYKSKRSKAPKADMRLLIEKGVLRNGQKLFLVDYQNNRVQKFTADVSGSDLFYQGQRYSMSNLAQELLTKVGFTSNAVRGPAHWVTDDGKKILDLWQQYLDDVARK